MANRWHCLTLAVGLVAVLTLPVPAGEPDNLLRESLTRWQHFQELEFPAAGNGPWLDAVLPNSVFDGAALDLADLRLYDGSEQEIPYAVRTLRQESRVVAAKTNRFNQATDDGNVQELTLEILDDDIEYNEIIVDTAGDNFRREVLLEGSDDARQWRRIREQKIVRFRVGERFLEDKTIAHPPVRFRYLRFRVSPDPVFDHDAPTIKNVVIRHRIEIPGQYTTQNGELSKREPVRTPSGPGSAWIIHLGRDQNLDPYEQIPCERILVDMTDAEFNRNYEILAGGPEGSQQPLVRVAEGNWRRRKGEKRRVMTATFPEVRASRLKLVITDYRNPPLNITCVRFVAPVRQMVIPSDTDVTKPLRLYFGNPDAEAANYDFARNLPTRLESSPTLGEFGNRQKNPAYTPLPPPLSERVPWLIYVVLGAVILVLAALILSVGRAAIAAHDQQQVAAG